MNKTYIYLIFTCASLLMISGCQKEQTGIHTLLSKDILRFEPYIAGTAHTSGSSNVLEVIENSSLKSMDGDSALFLTYQSKDGKHSDGSASNARTKADLINNNDNVDYSSIDLDSSKPFYVSAWSGDTRAIPDGVSESTETFKKVTHKTGNGGSEYWITVDSEDNDMEYQWTSGQSYVFYAYSNLPSVEGAAVISSSKEGETLVYDLSKFTSSAGQTDILMGCYTNGETAKTDGIVPISFCHPLTAVIFKAGDMGDAVINSISIENVYKSGTATLTVGTAAETDVKDRFTWVPASGEDNVMTVSQGIAAMPVPTMEDANPQIGEPFLLIPQDFTGNSNARIKISVTIGAENKDLYYSLKDFVWNAGYTNEYIINCHCEESSWICFTSPTTHEVAIGVTEGGYGFDFSILNDYYFEYSYDTVNWLPYPLLKYGYDIWYDSTEQWLEFGPDKPVYFRGLNPNGLSYVSVSWNDDYLTYGGENGCKFYFSSDGTEKYDVSVSGDIMSLIDKNCDFPLIERSSVKGEYYCSAFGAIFRNTPICDASELKIPTENLTSYCCTGMFMGSALTNAPELPAMNLAPFCYAFMFESTPIETGPDLPALTLANSCYAGMFGFSAIKSVSISATELADNCCNAMFLYCNSLTTAPIPPATEMAGHCYNCMFFNCDNIECEEIPSTVLARYCFRKMFWRSGIRTAPEIPATTLAEACCMEMFKGCENLAQAPELLPAMTLAESCYAGMFSGCNNLEEAPVLPATDLAPYCYQFMFSDCNNLEEAPELPATTLASECYHSMFYGCNKVKEVRCMAVEGINRDCTVSWLYGTSSEGTFYYNPEIGEASDALALFGGNSYPTSSGSSYGIPQNWTVLPIPSE